MKYHTTFIDKDKANPQIEDGYTPIANELMEVLMKIQISLYEYKVLMCVLRKTWGWRKKMDFISLSQFEEATGIKRHNLSKPLKSLEARNIISVDHAKKNTSYLGCNLYSFQKDYTKWLQPDGFPCGFSILRVEHNIKGGSDNEQL